MRISAFGYIWLLLLVVSLFKPKHTLWMVFISFVFQAAWVVIIAGIDLNAALITSVFYITKTIVRKRGKVTIPSWGKKGLLFVGVLLICSVINPLLFSGMELPLMTNEGYNFNRVDVMQVSFSFSNLTIGLSVLLYLLDAIMIYNDDCVDNWTGFEEIYRQIFAIVSIIGLLHVILASFGMQYNVLRELFHNEYQIGGATYFDYPLIGRNFYRLMSTFYEPSYCGAYLATSLMFFWFSENNKKRNICLLINAVELVLCMASTGFVTLAGAIILLLLRDFGKQKKIVRRKRVIMILCAVIIGIYIIWSNKELSRIIYEFTLGKVNSGSADLRNIQNHNSLEAFKKTYGLGTGGNTTISYSLIYSLLSQTGILGFALYFAFMASIIRKAYLTSDGKSAIQIICLIICPLISQIVSIQAFNFCVMWMGICGVGLRLSLSRRNKEGN